jgi:serine phosphatase RsbU (regulator of sigma subunit)
MQVLVVNTSNDVLPAGATESLRTAGWEITSAPDYASAILATNTGNIDAVIVDTPDEKQVDPETREQFESLLMTIEKNHVAGLVLDDEPITRSSESGSLIDIVDRRAPLAELRGRLSMIARYQGLVQRLDAELENMQGLGFRLNNHFREIDQEMRLAGRLQRDFLPDLSRPFGPLQFAASYCPASWVSGDIFDVFPLDRHQTGFYIADAVGHGMAASLLTMFIKRAIVSTRTDGVQRTILTPSETINLLNDALNEQSLSNCQFVTACYGLVDHRTHLLRLARGGHPYPILITADGRTKPLETPGGLLGVFKSEEFPTLEVQMSPGDKLLLFTDGVELVAEGSKSGDPGRLSPDQVSLDSVSHEDTWHAMIAELAHHSICEIVVKLEAQLEALGDAATMHDDITLLGLEVLK